MVLKKPYAFMIKHFKTIHLFLLIPMLYLIIKTRGIVTFFNNYVSFGYSINFSEVLTNISGRYINILMYVSIIIILIAFIFMSILLQQKEKPTKLYNICIVYYIALFIVITACFSFFNAVEADTLDDIFARFIRDIGFIVYFSQYVLVILTFIRGIGFNIKQFNFKSDLEDLEIENEDSEEFEFLVGKDTYEAKRTVRRFFRELKYYYLENKFIFSVIFVIAAVAFSTFLYLTRETKQKVYKENESLSFGQVNIKVKDSFISNLSNNGKTISPDKSYVILLLEIKNRYTVEKDFNHENLGLIVNKKRIQPSISLGSYFSDYGNPYSGTKIPGDSTVNYVLAYEIDKYLVNGSFSLQAYSHTETTPGGLGVVNKEIKLKPSIINSNVVTNTVNRGTSINLNRTNLKNSSVAITDYKIATRFEYQTCKEENDCITNAVSSWDFPSGYNKTLLILDYDLNLDENSTYYNLNRDYKTFFNDFLEIKYDYNRRTYTTKVTLLNLENYKDKLIVMVPNTINSASSISAVITIRNVSYQIKLK